MSLASRLADLTTAIANAFNARVTAPASGYDVAKLNGYTGTQAQWLADFSDPGNTDYAAQFNSYLTAPVAAGFATETSTGVAQYGTTAEVLAGTATNRAVSPAKLSAITEQSMIAYPSLVGNVTATYVRLATIDGIDTNTGANVEVLVTGLGNIILTNRASALVQLSQRGANTARLRVSWLSGPADLAIFWYRQLSTYQFELWMQVNAYQAPPRVTLLDSWNRINSLCDVYTTTTPTSLVASDNKETDWSFGTGTIAWDGSYFENSIRRIPNGLEINFGVKKSNGGTWSTGDPIITFGASLKPGVYGNGSQISIPAYNTSGAGWGVAPANGNITQNGIYYSGSASAVHGLFGTFRVNGYGVN